MFVLPKALCYLPFVYMFLYIVLGLMYKYITRSKFTTNPDLRSIFSTFRHFRLLFTSVFFSSLLRGEFVQENFANCILKARFGSEIGLSESCIRAIVGHF